MLLVAYDIPDPTEVAAAMRALLVSEEDNIRIHPLCAACMAKSVMLGKAAVQAPPTGAFRLI